LCNSGESVEIGEFLNREDALELLALLRRELQLSEPPTPSSLAC
jgi:hypothetical protein